MSVEAPSAPEKRPASTQRFIVRQTAIKCATDLVASRQIPIEQLFRYAGRITAWIYSTKEDPTGQAAEAPPNG